MFTIDMDTYLKAYGLAMLMECDADRAHLFARNYCGPRGWKDLEKDFKEFQNKGVLA